MSYFISSNERQRRKGEKTIYYDITESKSLFSREYIFGELSPTKKKSFEDEPE